MAMIQTGPKVAANQYIILSGEDKEVGDFIPEGSTCLEIDTNTMYYYYKGAWEKLGGDTQGE